MTNLGRRTFLSSAGCSLLAIQAGCLGDELAGDDRATIEYEMQESAPHRSRAIEKEEHSALFWYAGSDQVFTSLDDLDWQGREDVRADVEDFISHSDESEEFLDIRSTGPTLKDTLEIDELTYDEEAIWGGATVNVEEGIAPAEESFMTILVRYEATDELPSTIRFEITDGWDEPKEFSLHRK